MEKKRSEYVSVKVGDDLRSQLDAAVVSASVIKRRPVSVSEVVRDAIEAYLERLNNAEQGR